MYETGVVRRPFKRWRRRITRLTLHQNIYRYKVPVFDVDTKNKENALIKARVCGVCTCYSPEPGFAPSSGITRLFVLRAQTGLRGTREKIPDIDPGQINIT